MCAGCALRGVGCARLRRAGMAKAEDICPSWRRPLFPISGTMLRLKQHDAPEDVEYYLCGPPMMAKTVLDLWHSLGVDDADIRFDNL